MVNGSFVFGMDGDGPDVFDRTVEWAVEHGIETATFHIMTPYPGTALYDRMAAQDRLLHRDWDRYDTRQVVFQPQRNDDRRNWRTATGGPTGTSTGGARSGAAPSSKTTARDRLRHLAYAAGWKKFEPLWNVLIRARQVLRALPLLESVLSMGE